MSLFNRACVHNSMGLVLLHLYWLGSCGQGSKDQHTLSLRARCIVHWVRRGRLVSCVCGVQGSDVCCDSQQGCASLVSSELSIGFG